MITDQHETTSTSPSGSDKWVTFNDLVDDAMEGGKLSPIHLRNPVRRTRAISMPRSSSLAYLSTSASSNSSFETGSDVASLPPPPGKGNLRRKRFSISMINESGPKPDFNHSFGGFKSTSSSGDNQHDTYAALKQVQSQLNWSSPPPPPESEDDSRSGDDDKYAAFHGIHGKAYTGWSTRVMGTGPLGWSDDLLNASSSPEAVDSGRLKVEEEPWYKGHGGIRNGTWDRSPSRTFVRNFP